MDISMMFVAKYRAGESGFYGYELKRGQFEVLDDVWRVVYSRRGWHTSVSECRRMAQVAWENGRRVGKIRGRYPTYKFN